MAKTFWSDTLLHTLVGSGGQAAISLVSDFSNEELRLASLTLMRTIIGIDVAYSVHDSGEGSQLMDIAIGVESQEAFAAGVHPDPKVGSDHPVRGWVFRARGRVFGFAADQPAVYSWRLDRDIRSRRKLENGEAFIVIDNTPAEGAAGSVSVSGLIRQLWLVH